MSISIGPQHVWEDERNRQLGALVIQLWPESITEVSGADDRMVFLGDTADMLAIWQLMNKREGDVL